MDGGNRLLEIFDPDPGRAEDKVRELYVRLVKFFDWRDCALPGDLAQETLRRGFSRILTDVEIYTSDPSPFFFGIANNIVHEDRKQRQRAALAVDIEELIASLTTSDARHTDALICLEQCLRRLDDDEREMLSRYMLEDPAALARDLRLTPGALRVRAHRATEKLRRWIQQATTAAGVK